MHSVHKSWRSASLAAAFGGLLLMIAPVGDLLGARVRHEIPPSVTVLAFIKPEADRMRVLIRVPLESMRDLQFPLRDSVYLVISRAEPLIRPAVKLWISGYLSVYEGRTKLKDSIVAARISLPSDKSFSNYDSALAHFNSAPLADSTMLPWKQALLDVLLEYPIVSSESKFAVDPALAHLGIRTTTVLRFLPVAGGERALQYSGNPGLVRLDPSWFQAAALFVKLGFEHIMGGIDHLLFLFCLVIPFRKVRPLVMIVTAFTVAHSITLIASALNFAPAALWFAPLIETLIAISILFLAFENIIGARLQRRWIVAFVFGLVHGFGFSFFLRESLQFAGSHLTTSLLAFNIGVELGQLFMIAVAVPLLVLLFRYVVAARVGTIILSALVAHTAWHWMTARGSELMQYNFEMPAMDAAWFAGAMRWMMLLLFLVGVVWLLVGVFGRIAKGDPESVTEGSNP